MSEATSPLADLVLVRLLFGTKPATEKVIAKDLSPLFVGAVAEERVKKILEELRMKEFLPKKKSRVLTEAGRTHAMKYLGITKLPRGCNWRTVKAKFLMPKAFGLTPWSEAEVKRAGEPDKIVARLLKQRHDLNVPGETPRMVFEALLCKLLGFPQLKTITQLSEIAPKEILKASGNGKDALRALVLNGTFTDVTATEPKPDAVVDSNKNSDLKTFADHVLAAAKTCPTGWTGDIYVLISHVWNFSQTLTDFPNLDLATFKSKLIAAMRERFIVLSRADLPQGMDQEDLRNSLTAYGTSEYHFIKIQRGN